MRTMKWWSWLGIGLVAVCVAFATVGCGDDDNDDGEGTTTVVVTNQTTVVTNAPAPLALVAPQLVTPANGMDNDVFYIGGVAGLDFQFEWTAVPGAASYVLEINGVQRTVAGTTTTVTLPYGDYNWRVWAKDANGASGPPSVMFSFNV